MTTRIQAAKPEIVRYFDEMRSHVFRLNELAEILIEQREQWRLAKSTTTAAFVRFLIEEGRLARRAFPFPHRAENLYTWGEVPFLEVVQAVKPKSYFCHYTAVRMHGLTEQVPKVIYLNHEQRPHTPSGTLEQKGIDAAFARRPRTTTNVITFGDSRITLINGMHTDELGVITESVMYESTVPATVRLTGLERTLIDIAVRPVYSGGVIEVLKAYRFAQERLSVNRIKAMLEKMNFVYPYHQAIGFYLERAGIQEKHLDLLREIPARFDFYLTNQMGDKDYVKKWRLYIPKGL